MKSQPRELEIKLELTTEQVRRLGAWMRSAGPTQPRSEILRSTYFDTIDRSLRAKGLAFRVRRIGDTWVQTLKADRAIDGGVSNPIELEAEIECGEPSIDAIEDKKLRRKVERCAAASPLVAMFDTVVERTSLRLTTGRDDIEIALDVGTVRAGSESETLREAEIELKAGSPVALLAIAREITSKGPMRPSREGKADRGYRLLGEKPPLPIEAPKSLLPAITPGMTSGAAIREICRTTGATILRNWQLLEGQDDAEAAHQLRVALRRLRSALRILRSAYDDKRLRELCIAVRDLGRAVGRLRDMDVLMSEIVEPLAGAEHVAEGIAILRRGLTRERKARRVEVVAALQASQLGIIRLEVGLLPHIVDDLADANPKQLSRPVEDLAGKALRKFVGRVMKRGRDLQELTIEQRHELRKAIKPLRYSVEFFAPLYPRANTRRVLACAAELQITLGYLNDVALAEGLLELKWPPGKAREADAVRANGAVIGWHAARAEQAWGEVKSSWRKFERAAQFLA